MVRYVSLVKQRLESFASWKLEHIPRDSNERVDALAVVVCVPPSKRNNISSCLSPTGIINYYQPGKRNR